MTRTPSRLIVGSMLAALAAVPGVAAPQQAPPLAAGQRVRVTLRSPNDAPIVGELLERTDSALLVRLDSLRTRQVGIGDVRRVDVSRGVRSGARTGARIGALVGLAGGLAAGIATRPRGPSCHNSSGGLLGIPDLDLRCLETVGATLGWVALSGTAGGVVGLGLGTLVGHAFHGERWEEVPLDRVRLTLRPRAGGVVFVGSLAF